MDFYVLFVTAAFLLVLFFIVYSVRGFLDKRKVEKESEALKALRKLNAEYAAKFNAFTPMSDTTRKKTRQQAVNFNFDKRFREIVSEERYFNPEEISEEEEENDALYKEYMKKYSELPSSVFSDRRLIAAEASALVKECLGHPGRFLFTVRVAYTSPKGQSTYQNYRTYNVQALRRVMNDIEKENAGHDDRYEQRKLMTSKMRYAVLQRDGFRCQICGRTQEDGVKLHVDHIIPVAKGGKTEMSNLRTLCDECNLGKSDSYDPESEYN